MTLLIIQDVNFLGISCLIGYASSLIRHTAINSEQSRPLVRHNFDQMVRTSSDSGQYPAFCYSYQRVLLRERDLRPPAIIEIRGGRTKPDCNSLDSSATLSSLLNFLYISRNLFHYLHARLHHDDILTFKSGDYADIS